MAKARRKNTEPPVPITMLKLDHSLAKTPEERKRIRDINKQVIDLACVRLRGGPIASLIDRKKIGPEEVRAAQEIDKAFTAITLGLGFKPISLERSDRSHGDSHWPLEMIRLMDRYNEWAKFWSERKQTGDKSLSICIAAVVDEQSFTSIEDNECIRNGLASKVVARLLRDYAARAKWVTGHLADQWKSEAMESFKTHTPLTLAVAKHRALRAEEMA